jgi:integrase/recombinase XerD
MPISPVYSIGAIYLHERGGKNNPVKIRGSFYGDNCWDTAPTIRIDARSLACYTVSYNVSYRTRLTMTMKHTPHSPVALPPSKPPAIVSDKILAGRLPPTQANSLRAWMALYTQIHVVGAPLKTQQAKARDLEKFARFVQVEVGHDQIDGWTPAVTKAFQSSLLKTISPVTQQAYKATTVNRVLATVRHFATWVHAQRPLLAGNPLVGVRDVQTDAPDWNGVQRHHLLRLKAACEQRLKHCDRIDQSPLREAAIFFMLLHTGLRRSEVVGLNVSQYHHSGLHDVMRYKSKRITRKIHLPQEARDYLDQYLATRSEPAPDEPLFISRYGNRFGTKDVWRICQRLARQANAQVADEKDKFTLAPHKLRHTYLKQFADKHGLSTAQEASGNVSTREIFRYTKPSQAELDEAVETLYD